jgi:hypothetical protein
VGGSGWRRIETSLARVRSDGEGEGIGKVLGGVGKLVEGSVLDTCCAAWPTHRVQKYLVRVLGIAVVSVARVGEGKPYRGLLVRRGLRGGFMKLIKNVPRKMTPRSTHGASRFEIHSDAISAAVSRLRMGPMQRDGRRKWKVKDESELCIPT